MLRIGVAVLAALVTAAPALAGAAPGWSAARMLHVGRNAATALAVNGRGDVVVAWMKTSNPLGPRRPGTAVHVSAWTRDGRLRSRTVWTSRRAIAGHLAVAVDARGEVTVAWMASTDVGRGGTVRAAYGPIRGRWRPPRRLGHGADDPQLAVAPGGDVLLSWARTIERPAVAWRSRGRPFGRPQRLHQPRLTATPTRTFPLTPAFDAAGRAYLSSACSPILRIARPGAHRFGRAERLARGNVLGLRVAATGRGEGLIAWIDGSCSPDVTVGDTPGDVHVATLDGGSVGPERQVTVVGAAYDTAVAARPDGSGTVAWGERRDGHPAAFTDSVAANGAVTAVAADGQGLIPVDATGGGDVVMQWQFGDPATFSAPGLAVVERVTGRRYQAPHAPSQVAVSRSGGRRVAVLWPAAREGTLALSRWRPH